jgi:hypothetical protein
MALARWQRTIVDNAGNILPGAQITVRREVPGAPLAVLYSDRDGTTPLGNPFQAAPDGFAFFFTAGGPLRIDVVSGSFSRSLRYVPIGLAAERDYFDLFVPRGAWSGATTYAQGDLVEHEGFAFLSNIDANLNHEPVLDGEPPTGGISDANWTFLVAQAGQRGEPGSSDVRATSPTPLLLSIGEKLFAINEADRGWAVGARLRASSVESPATHYMEGVVTVYDEEDSELTLLVDLVEGVGTPSGWTINLAGETGSEGDPGSSNIVGTSVTPITIGTGEKVFTIAESDRGWGVGARLRASDSSGPIVNFMEGIVSAYSGTSLTLQVDIAQGSGEISDWTINLTGVRGTQGVQGEQGEQGGQGDPGLQGAPGVDGLDAPALVSVPVHTTDEAVASASGAGGAFWRVPAAFDGYRLAAIGASVFTPGTGGSTSIQVRNVTQSVDMLSTPMLIEDGETGTQTSSQPGTIDTNNAVVAEGDLLVFDLTVTASSAPMGLIADLIFSAPDDFTNFFIVAATSSNNTATIALPAAVNAGDLLLLFQASTSTNPAAIPTAVTPAGWTNLVNQGASLSTLATRYMIDYKIADGSEDNSLVTGMDSTADRKVVAQFRKDQPIASVALVDLGAEATDDDPADQVVNSSAGSPPLVVFGCYFCGQTTAIATRGFSPDPDGELLVIGSLAFYVRYKIYDVGSSPVDHTVSMDDVSTANNLLSFYLEVS